MILFLVSCGTLAMSLYILKLVDKQRHHFNSETKSDSLHLLFQFIFFLIFLLTAFSHDILTNIIGPTISAVITYFYLYKPYTYVGIIPIEQNIRPQKSALGHGLSFLKPQGLALFHPRHAYGRFSVYEDFIVVRIPLEETKIFARSDLESLEEKIWQREFLIKFNDGTVYRISDSASDFIQFLQKIVQENQDKSSAKS